MSRLDENHSDDLFELLKTLGEAGSRVIQGIYSSPWTGVPFTLIVLAKVDPTGKMTVAFLNNLGVFLGALAKAANEALQGVFTLLPKPLPENPLPPGITIPGTGGITDVTTPGREPGPSKPFCYRIRGFVNTVECFATAAERDAHNATDALGLGEPFQL